MNPFTFDLNTDRFNYINYMKLHILFYCIIIAFTCSCELAEDRLQVSHDEFRKSHLYNIGQSTIQFQDTLRARPLKTEIWYPTNDTTGLNIIRNYPFILPPTSKDAKFINSTFPLIILSHGTGGNRISQMWLACELASNGFIVAAVDHFGNTLDNKIPENFVKIWDRPLDITYVLDRLFQSSKFKSVIDTTRIGMAGFSLGGFTTIALAGGEIDYNLLKEFSKTDEGEIEFTVPELGNVSELLTSKVVEEGSQKYRNLKDDRISAFIAMAPALGQGFKSPDQFKKVDSEILVIGAQNDLRTPVNTNSRHYNKLIEHSKYIELEGNVGHYVFMNAAKRKLKRNVPLIFKDGENVDRLVIHSKVSNHILDFLRKELDN